MVSYFGSQIVGYFGSQGLQNVATWLAAVQASDDGIYGFPAKWRPGAYERQGAQESVSQYFRRILEEVFEGNPESAAIEESVLALISLTYENGSIQRLNIETFIAPEMTLADAYYESEEDDENDKAIIHYLRMDYDPGQPGPLFLEPQPHIHVQNGAPRMNLSLCSSRSLMGGFFDVLYRNYLPGKWHDWARNVWKDLARDKKWEFEIFNRIAEAYNDGEVELLETEYLLYFNELKIVLNDALDEIFPAPRRDFQEFGILSL